MILGFWRHEGIILRLSTWALNLREISRESQSSNTMMISEFQWFNEQISLLSWSGSMDRSESRRPEKVAALSGLQELQIGGARTLEVKSNSEAVPNANGSYWNLTIASIKLIKAFKRVLLLTWGFKVQSQASLNNSFYSLS